MAENVFSMQFDSSGCTNKLVKDLGAMNYDSNSTLGNHSLRCAYFQPYNSDAGFEVHSSSIKATLESKKPYCLYFRFRTSKMTKAKLPIIMYKDDRNKNFLALYVENQRFIIAPNRFVKYMTPKVEYTANDEFHCFYMSWDEEHTLRVYVDGNLLLEKLEADPFTFADTFFIGVYSEGSKEYHLDGWYLDDFNVFSGIVFRNEFEPPTDYLFSINSITNYYGNNDLTRSNMDRETIDSVEMNREHTLYSLRRTQKGTLPKRIRCNWHEGFHGYFRNHAWEDIRKTDVGTYINIEGIDQPILSGNVPYYQGNMNITLDEGLMLPMMIFVNGQFRRLSKIDIIKSDDYYCFHIKDRDRSKSDPVTSFEVIVLPFPVVYEEDYGERDDLIPLYCFNKDGYFDPLHAHTYYYIDETRDEHTKHIGIRKEAYDPTEEPETHNIMHAVWRYGTLEPIRLDDDGKAAFMRFQSEDYSWVDQTSTIVLYNGVSLIDPALYKIIGHDLIYFHNLLAAGIREGRTVCMMVLTDSTNPFNEMIFQDVTETKIVSIRATIMNQSVFNIPEVSDDGKWRKFLLFRGPILMEQEKQYTVDWDNGTITITNHEDYITKDRVLHFLFVKVNRSGTGGNFLIDPVFIYTTAETEYSAKIEQVKGITITKMNSVLFRNGTAVNPERYEIRDDHIYFNDDEPPMNFLDSETSLILVVLKLIQADKDTTSWRANLIRDEWTKGNRFVLYDLTIPKRIKITLDNLLCFDQNGRLITDLRGKIYNMNIIKRLMTKEPLERQIKYLTCVYRDDYLENGSHVMKDPLNDSYIKDYISGKREFHELDQDFDQFLEDFNFRHYNDRSYGENLRNSISAITQYDPNKLDDVYDKLATSERIQYDTNRINTHMDSVEGGYRFNIPPEKLYSSPVFTTRHIFFQDGMHANWNKDVYHTATDDMVVSVPSKFSANTKLESIAFKGMCNDLIPLNGIPTSIKQASSDIMCTIITGNDYSYDIDSTIAIKEYLDLDIPASIKIPMGFDYAESKNEFYMDLFTGAIEVSNTCSIEIPCTLDIKRWPDGVIVDLDSFNMRLDFNATIIVK